MHPEQILTCALDIGEQMLLCGAEIGRVEDSIRLICSAYGCTRTDVFTITSSEVFARVMKTPTTTFLVPSLIPLIPGGSLYYTMNYALNEQWSAFAGKAFDTLALALALALGIIAVTTLTRMVMVISKKLRGKELISIFHHNL